LEIEKVQTIKFLREQSSKLVREMEPMNDYEWEVLELLTSVHKGLRKIDLGKCGQMTMLKDDKPPKEQMPLTPGAAVTAGEDSLNEGEKAIAEFEKETGSAELHPTIPNLENIPQPGERNPTLCLSCSHNGQCSGNGIILVNDEEKCKEYDPKEGTPEKKKRGRKSKTMPDSEL
jgi:hypothetical protein